MNVIFICVDTLRYDYIHAHGTNDAVQTPNMDRLLSKSWVFDNAYCASYPTIPHRTDVITGRYGGPFHQWRPLPFHVPTLPEALARAGYCTQLIHDSPHLVNGGHAFDYPFHAWTPVRGAEVDRPWISDNLTMPPNWAFDPLFDDVAERGLDAWKMGNHDTYLHANRGRETEEDWNCCRLFRTASEFLRDNARRENFFLWIDCFDPHEPWDAPHEFMLKYDQTPGYDGSIDPRSFTHRNLELSEAAKQRVRYQYAAKVSWVDHCLGSFLAELEKAGLEDNTAIILTADHGTRDGREGSFGKSIPVGEGEGHVPFVVYAPEIGTGRSDLIVQPQDVWVTVMGLIGEETPLGLDSNDVVELAQRGDDGPRAVALAGQPPNLWKQEGILFSVFDGQWCLGLAAQPEGCTLVRMGEQSDQASEHPALVSELWTHGVSELEGRGCDPKIVAWLESRGEKPWPRDCRYHDHWPLPPGYVPYFQRLYHGG